jgi:PAS domain S-box-containing protein
LPAPYVKRSLISSRVKTGTGGCLGIVRHAANGLPINQDAIAGDFDPEHFASIVSASPNFVAIATTEGRLSYLNAAGRMLIELDAAEAAGSLTLTSLFLPEDLALVREVALNELTRNGRWNGPLRFRNRATDLPVAIDLSLYHVRDGRSDAAPLAIAIVARDVHEQRRNEQRLRALLDAGTTLTNIFDARRAFTDLAELIVRTLATLCVVDLFNDAPDGAKQIERVASYHIDREWRGSHAQIAAFIPSGENATHPVAQLLKDGRSTLVGAISEDWVDANMTSPEHAAFVRAMQLHSLITVPLVARGEIVGALTCALGREAVPRASIPAAYDNDDLFFLEELGRRAGRSIETARLYERERRIAMTLQAASLPTSLPTSPVFHIDAEYRPGKAEATIGGDWFDAFILGNGRIVLTVGDVLGNGLHAAVTMTKLRQAMQSAAMVQADPNVMLDVADATLRLHASDGYATAIAAIYDPDAHRTVIASAGHPGPVLRHGDGAITSFMSPGLLLGMRDGTDTIITEIPTPPGSLLVFFTDGLTEATRDDDEGNRRLQAALNAPEIIASEHPARAIVEHVLRGENAGDDIAVLTLQIR